MTERGADRLAWILKHTDVALAVMVVLVVAMMILPLPTWLLDILIATNVTMGVTLLLVVLYVSEPLAIATFPTILLLTTLFRLALNISTTRLILLHADAGRIIDAFGNFVVAGNYVVGGVIFLILTLVQFIVIAKGSERVAEVAARFTLDAMPGKQMSIDADVRSGLIDSAGARARRSHLEREAQFYGAMDGAMKFVKGDAIAGICITCVNIIAGLIVGIWQMNMDAAEALQTYTLLTIGDGLVSQIPALVLSMSAGFLITRVASEEPGSHLGADVGRQILSQPRALKIVAALLIGLGLVPGMPLGPFLILGLFVGFVGFSIERGPSIREAVKKIGKKRPPPAEPAPPPEEGPLVHPVILDITQRVAGAGEEPGRALDRAIPAMRGRLFEDLGLKLPPVRVRVGEPEPGLDFIVRIQEVPSARGTVPEEKFFCSLDPQQLRDGGLEVEEAHDPLTGGSGGWIQEAHEPRARTFGCRLLDAHGYVIASLEEAVRSRAHDLVSIQEVQDLLDTLEDASPALVRSTVPKPVDLRTLTEVCRRLVEEGVSLRHMAEILQTLARWMPSQRDPVALTELVRASLARPVSARHAVDGSSIDVFLVEPAIEDAIRTSIHKTEQGSFLALDPEVGRDIREAVSGEIAGFPMTRGRVPVILVQADVRRYLRKLIELDHPRAAVLSYQELDPALEIRPAGEIKIARTG
ncbi:MAG: type III secretion system export apparatus subunit SctV [Deltaproteobacteria bacterium]|nr:type III secretion system export apparatus subunit SctV [Deltaproteobacteria bacterium]